MEAFFVCKEVIENALQIEESSGVIARKNFFLPRTSGTILQCLLLPQARGTGQPRHCFQTPLPSFNRKKWPAFHESSERLTGRYPKSASSPTLWSLSGAPHKEFPAVALSLGTYRRVGWDLWPACLHLLCFTVSGLSLLRFCLAREDHDSSHPNTDTKKMKLKPLNALIFLH